MGSALFEKMMRRYTASLFKANNRRRGEWNALLLVMFALLTVAPSVLAAAPQGWQGAASQPQAVWQWLQSPAGAPTRDLLVRAFELENFPDLPPAEMAAVISALHKSPQLAATTAVDWPQHLSRTLRTPVTHLTGSLNRPLPSLVTLDDNRRIFAGALSPHQAALRSGTRTNRRME